ncbi:RecA-family ATPase-like protein [Mycobacteroides abscessus]|nr:RecA-family ATPase-like protein [Mycobacteroides abscessus]CPS26353.1 RecA-family ATPase-like protein [Mycobacteroides abscessus]CPS28873.1 RecA-family ATPase-like protein [Mycobacteroides abscessus]CPT09682.1 RecA-family ATPase-like protein [Mycobacteroides abscessus]CPT29308.1 RecA-family ATPase-like protein [Mycobacteroides abscessus]
MLKAALRYAQMGWRVFPCKPKSKQPATEHGFKDATTSVGQIESWWDSNPHYNIGVCPPDDVVVFDLDKAPAVEGFGNEFGPLPETLITRTRRGRHQYYRVPAGVKVPTTAEFNRDAVDVKVGASGYLIAAPSAHPGGGLYEWVKEDAPIADLPELLVRRFNEIAAVKAAPKPAPQPVRTSEAPYYRAALEQEMVAMASTGEGRRNDQLNTSAFNLGQLVPHGLGESEVIDALSAAARSTAGTPMTEREIERTIRSGLQSGMALPRLAPENPGFTPSLSVAPSEPPDAESTREAEIASRMGTLAIDREARRRLDEQDRPPVTAPAVTGLGTLLATPDTAAEYSINEVAPLGGRVMLSAQYKAGKSTLVGNVIRSRVDRAPFLERFEVPSPARSVVLIDTELSEGTLRRWLRDQNIVNASAVSDVVALRGRVGAFDLIDRKRRAEWAARLRELRCDYLILDCLRPVLDALGLDEHRDAGRFLVAFDALLSEADVSDALVVHHMGHSNERARGDSRLQDWPDALWRLVRENDEPGSARFFSAYGRDVDVREGRLTFDPETRHLSYVDGSRTDSKAEAARPDVLGVLADAAKSASDGLSGRQVEDALKETDHSRGAIRDALKALVALGVLATADGARRSKLHRIANSCSDCGYPLAAGQESRHIECGRALKGAA